MNGPLVDLGKLSEPATKLIEKVSEAVGGIARPWQIRRVAKAEADADMIKALSQLEITEVQQRALARVIVEEGRRQENIESITAQALPDLRQDAKPEALDADWLAHFFDRCRHVSDKEMQSLWARLLAGQTNSPNSISRRTVELVSTFEKSDANLFTSLCGFAWPIGRLTPLVFDVEADIYEKQGIMFSALQHLESLGLIAFDPIAGYQRKGFPQRFKIDYYGRSVAFELPLEKGNSLDIGKVVFSRAGDELAPLCGSRPVPEFAEYVKANWEKGGKIKMTLDP